MRNGSPGTAAQSLNSIPPDGRYSPRALHNRHCRLRTVGRGRVCGLSHQRTRTRRRPCDVRPVRGLPHRMPGRAGRAVRRPARPRLRRGGRSRRTASLVRNTFGPDRRQHAGRRPERSCHRQRVRPEPGGGAARRRPHRKGFFVRPRPQSPAGAALRRPGAADRFSRPYRQREGRVRRPAGRGGGATERGGGSCAGGVPRPIYRRCRPANPLPKSPSNRAIRCSSARTAGAASPTCYPTG